MAMLHRRNHPVRNIEIRTLLDTFFVSSVTMILVIRLQLWATHYPKLGGGRLHIAHLLWGGLLMLVAIVILLSFLGRARKHAGAVLGGLGFGFFIDEIGKFTTSDNDYFFRPAAGMIYIVFVLLFLTMRWLGWRREWTPQECLTNAIELLTEAARQGLHAHDRLLARRMLERSDQSDPLVAPLESLLDQIECAPQLPPDRPRRIALRLRAFYFQVIQEPWFATALVAVFAAVATVTIVQVVLDAHAILSGHQRLHVISVAGLASSVVASGSILAGVVRLRESRMAAYRWFDHALLVQVFFTEVFAFLESQFAAVFGLLLNLTLLLTLRLMIRAESHLALTEGDALMSELAPRAGSTVAAKPA